MFPKYLFFFGLFLLIAGFYLLTQKQQQESLVPVSTGTVGVLGVQTKTEGCQVRGPFPDSDCSPGAIFEGVTKETICVAGYSTSVRNVPQSEKDQVYAEYGITHHTRGEYEIDHIISLELGGSNDIANLFPEAAEPKPGFHEKDMVENYLHELVCTNKISLPQAQEVIRTNWLQVYQHMPK
jgi:hypothetical protein